jgi:hypothetical protein
MGQLQTLGVASLMSALAPRADMRPLGQPLVFRRSSTSPCQSVTRVEIERLIASHFSASTSAGSGRLIARHYTNI